jgi:rhodanese-related sulfurtransferase
MTKRYIILAIVAIASTLLLALLPSHRICNNENREKMHLKTSQCSGESVEHILLNSMNNERYMSVDELSAKIIGEDPSYAVIDIRDSLQFNNFSLPGSINIPFDKLLNNNNIASIDNEAFTNVLISNGTLLSDQAWMILRRKGIKNVKVLKGGLNEFFNVLMNPEKPKESDPTEAYDLYSFRKSAGVYFGLPNPQDFIPGGGSINTSSGSAPKLAPRTNTGKKAVAPVKQAVVEEEGC